MSAPKELKDRIDYVFKNDTDNIEPRLGGAWSLPASSSFLKYLTGTAPGTASLRGGYARKDGRIFQSVFSQGGANVRYNPPNALYQTFSTQTGVTSPGILNVADPTLGFVFTPGPQTARHSITKIDSGLEMPYTNEWSISYERQMPFDSALRVTYTGNHVTGNLRYTYDNLPVSPLTGPVTVVDHPNNAPAGTYPDLRGKTITKIAADAACAGTGYYGIATTTACPVGVPIADNEISLRVPRSNERRPCPPPFHHGVASPKRGARRRAAPPYGRWRPR